MRLLFFPENVKKSDTPNQKKSLIMVEFYKFYGSLNKLLSNIEGCATFLAASLLFNEV